jgi:putative transposase
VAEYRQWYNHHRAHQALPPNTAPAQAYTTLPKMAPPGEPIVPATKKLTDRFPVAEPLLVQRRAGTRGKVTYRNAVYVFGRAWQGQTLNIIHHPDRLEFFDSDGQFLFHTVWPAEHGQTGVARQVKTPAPPLPGKLENPRTALFKPSTKSSDPNVH